MTAFVVDLGGTRIKTGVMRNGELTAAPPMDTESRPLRVLLPHIADTVREVAESVGVAPRDGAGLVFGFPGIVDPVARRVVSTSGKYEDAVELDLVAWAYETLGLRLILENDARLALIGEWRHGAGRGLSDVVVVTLGTGLGTGVVSGGRVVRGAHGTGGILGGHISVRAGGRLCPCGSRGCAEVEASSSTLPQLIAEFAEKQSTALRSDHRYEDVFSVADDGDTVARRLRDHTVTVWGAFLTNLIHAYDPARVVVGGGIAQHAGVLQRLRKSVAETAWTPLGEVEIVRSKLGGEAALYSGEWLSHGERE